MFRVFHWTYPQWPNGARVVGGLPASHKINGVLPNLFHILVRRVSFTPSIVDLSVQLGVETDPSLCTIGASSLHLPLLLLGSSHGRTAVEADSTAVHFGGTTARLLGLRSFGEAVGFVGRQMQMSAGWTTVARSRATSAFQEPLSWHARADAASRADVVDVLVFAADVARTRLHPAAKQKGCRKCECSTLQSCAKMLLSMN